MKVFTSSYQSPIGMLSLIGNEKSLLGIGMQQNPSIQNINCNDLPIFAETKLWLDTYFSGNQPDFTPHIELIGSNFQKKVWQELLKIGYGETASYGNIAKRICCKSAQAIGQAVGRNPLLIIVPCHRVIAANRKPGGYSYGIERKIWLLEHEKKQ